MNGLYDTGDSGMAGVAVRAFDSTGAEVGSTTTASTGVYTLNITNAATAKIRVEFGTPNGYEPSIVTADASSAGSSIQFVDLGAANVNFGYQAPGDYCQATMALASVCMIQGALNSGATERVIGVSSFAPATTLLNDQPIAADQTDAAVTEIADKQSVGTTWGLAWQRTTRLLWNSAAIRRHASLGPKGLGGLYVYNLSGTKVASFDLAADKGLTLKAPTDDYSDAARDIVSALPNPADRGNVLQSRDAPGFAGVGTRGIGDIDFSNDGGSLWITNLYERKIHRITVGGTASAPTLGTVTSWSVDDGYSCQKPTLRPWGLEVRNDGSVLVAAVCSNDQVSPLTATSAPGEGVVLALNPAGSGAAAWTTLTTWAFDYFHRYDNCEVAPFTCAWKAWASDWSTLKPLARYGSSSQYWWTQPMVVDIEELADGSFALGVNDRLSFQGGYQNFEPLEIGNPASPANMTAWTAGDTLLLCRTSTGWVRESAGQCAGVNSYASSRTADFFHDRFSGHDETTIGGLALGRGQLAVAAMDPADFFVGGIRWISATNGNQTNALNLTRKATSINDGFGKSAAIGDLEALCDMAPLQIGNRVWYDIDADGIQDPDENPVPGVTLRLYNGSGSLVSTVVTNAKGEYYFTSTLTESSSGGSTPDEWGGNLQANTAYTIVMNKASDCDTGGPLDGWQLTTNDATTSATTSDQEDRIDSDAVASGVTWCSGLAATVTVAPLGVGMVNHGYDIGFNNPSMTPPSTSPPTSAPQTPGSSQSNPTTNDPSAASATTATPTTTASNTAGAKLKVSVGDYVWWDLDRDGLQDGSDIPISGAILSITTADGGPVTDVNGNSVTTTVTDENGRYSFDNLPPGQYRVTVTPPIDAIATRAAAGKNTAKDSSTSSATSRNLTLDGDRDPTLDFGFYRPSVSVGDRVWRDTKGDGLQNKSDKGLDGFILSLRNVDGTPVVDAYGRPVKAITTRSGGKYLFTNLRPGRYVVEISYPRGYLPTTPNRPDAARNSSTLTAVSRVLRDGQSDTTLDFGVVRRPGATYRLLPATR